MPVRRNPSPPNLPRLLTSAQGLDLISNRVSSNPILPLMLASNEFGHETTHTSGDRRTGSPGAGPAQFRLAADAVTAALAGVPEVEAVALIGSVARPLWGRCRAFSHSDPGTSRSARMQGCRSGGVARSLRRLQSLNRARSVALQQLFKEKQIGVADHQVEIFILQGQVNAYRGRLCPFAQCPKGKRECLVPGCGRDAFLQQHAGFAFWPDALAPDKVMHLYDRQRGILRHASETPAEGQGDHIGPG